MGIIYPKSLYTKDVINVKDFGATGDGSTDDTAAIQAAIDAVDAAGSGVLVFPAGNTYVITGQLTFEDMSDFEVVLSGATLKADDTFSIGESASLLYFHRCTNWGVTGGIIDGNKSGRRVDGATGFYVFNVRIKAGSHATWRNVYIKDGAMDCLYINVESVGYGDGELPYDMTFHGCTCDGANRNGLSIVGGRQLRFFGCTFKNTKGEDPSSGVDIEPNADSTADAWADSIEYTVGDRVKHGDTTEFPYTHLVCHTAHTSAGAWADTEMQYWDLEEIVHDVLFSGCHFENNYNRGLLSAQSSGATAVTVEGCTFRGNYSGAVSARSVVNLIGNTITNGRDWPDWQADIAYDAGDVVYETGAGKFYHRKSSGTSGVAFDSDDWWEDQYTLRSVVFTTSPTNRGSVVRGNTFRNASTIVKSPACDIGVMSSGGYPLLIEGNTFEYTRRTLYAELPVVFRNNLVHKATQSVALVYLDTGADGSIVEDNVFKDTHNELVFLASGANNVLVRRNKAFNVDATLDLTSGGIWVSATEGTPTTGARIEDNRIEYTSSQGAVAFRVEQHAVLETFLGNSIVNSSHAFGGYILDGVCGRADRPTATVDTTNADKTTLDSFYTEANKAYHIIADVVAQETDDHDETASYRIIATVENDGDTPAIVGTNNRDIQEDTAGWDCNIELDGVQVELNVTGAAGTNITWRGKLTWMEVS